MQYQVKYNTPNVDLGNNAPTLNSIITEDKVNTCILFLPNNKSPGTDGILNEYITSSKHFMTHIYVSFLNVILPYWPVPTLWSECMIIAISKNKGDLKQPENYRHIPLLSCGWKLFTSDLIYSLKNITYFLKIYKK